MNLRWAFNIGRWKPSKEQWKLVVQCVPKADKDYCYKFCFVEDCKSSMVGRLLMRKAVSESCDISFDKISFSRTSSGKPYLLDDNFNFNISHNGDFCVLAASNRNMNVGIDVMKVKNTGKRNIEDFFKLMKKQFSSHEWDFINQPGFEIDQLSRFYRLWCLKESYVKAVGTGISRDLQSISFSCQTPILKQNIITVDTKLYLEGILQPQWTFEETFLDTDHCVAVALETGDQKNDISSFNQFTILSFETMMANCKPFEDLDQNFWEDFQSKDEKNS